MSKIEEYRIELNELHESTSNLISIIESLRCSPTSRMSTSLFFDTTSVLDEVERTMSTDNEPAQDALPLVIASIDRLVESFVGLDENSTSTDSTNVIETIKEEIGFLRKLLHAAGIYDGIIISNREA